MTWVLVVVPSLIARTSPGRTRNGPPASEKATLPSPVLMTVPEPCVESAIAVLVRSGETGVPGRSTVSVIVAPSGQP